MRVVVDMQGAQTTFSGGRGVGRYTREMVKALIRACKDTDEVFLALNGTFAEACEKLIGEFEGYIPRSRIKVWQWYPVSEPSCVTGVSKITPIELYREWFLQQFHADIIWSPNFQEGFFDYNVACTAGLIEGKSRVCTTLHDVIPLIYKKDYLDGSDSKEWYYEKLRQTVRCDFILTVSKFSKQKMTELLKIPEENVYVVYEGANPEIFYREDDRYDPARKEKIILYVGGADQHKNIRNLIRAYALLPDQLKRTYKLAFAGGEPERKKYQLLRVAAKCGVKKSSLIFYGYVSDDDLRNLFQTCAVFVLPSYSEGFGLPVIEAMECAAPVITARAASLPEIVGDERFMFDPFRPGDIADKICKILTDEAFAREAVLNGCRRAELFSWQTSGKELYHIFQLQRKRTRTGTYTRNMFYKDMALLCRNQSAAYQAEAAYSIENAKLFRKKRTIYIDTSAVVLEDYVTGIQRVVNGLIASLYKCFDGNSRVEICPVYSSPEHEHFIKAVYNGRKYVQQKKVTNAVIVQFYDGDVFFMPDLAPGHILAKEHYLRALVKRGIQVYTILHDLIPMEYPEFFSKDFVEEYRGYLQGIAAFSGVISVSKTTMEAYTVWCRRNGMIFHPYFLNTFHYSGSDFIRANPTQGLEKGYEVLLHQMDRHPVFLMVGTLEPRKKHDQVLGAMELLWAKGVDADLVFVGRNGWQMNSFVNRLKRHKERGKRLFWLSGISDEYLELLYQKAAAVIVASLAEGYGLPVIEGAQHGKPLILRDIPVFREVAGSHAFYFQGQLASELAAALEKWLELYRKGTVPASEGIPFVTWEQSAQKLMELVDFGV